MRDLGTVLMDHQNELFDAKRIARNQPMVHGSHNLSGQIEWYTPSQYIVSARKVMGSIDCDPATSALAQETIQATVWHTIDDDGLAQSWSGNVWLNPPYAAKIITPFVDKLIGHLESGDVQQAILLTHNNSDTKWAQKALMSCSALCATRGRVRFYDENGTANTPTHGHYFFYWGKRHIRFCKEFAQYGWAIHSWTQGECE